MSCSEINHVCCLIIIGPPLGRWWPVLVGLVPVVSQCPIWSSAVIIASLHIGHCVGKLYAVALSIITVYLYQCGCGIIGCINDEADEDGYVDAGGILPISDHHHRLADCSIHHLKTSWPLGWLWHSYCSRLYLTIEMDALHLDTFTDSIPGISSTYVMMCVS